MLQISSSKDKGVDYQTDHISNVPWQMQSSKSSVVVERSNGPSHACNSSNLAVWARQYPVFCELAGEVRRLMVACTGQGRESRAEQRRTERSVIPSHLRLPIPDRGPTSAHLGVGLSTTLAAAWSTVDYPARPVPYFLGPLDSSNICGLGFLSSTTKRTHARTYDHIGPSCEAASPAQPPASAYYT